MTDTTPFTESQTRALAHVLDDIIPASPDRGLPAAGALGAAAYVERSLAAMPGLKAMVADSLTQLDALARTRHPGGLDAMRPEERAAVLLEHAGSEHSFPPILILHAFAGYYQDPRVLELLGLPPRPPHPEGYAMEPDDLSLLDPVRQRGRKYRQC
ncbi:gluconate 2-dehydrogenase subunit 3 family protein [bacterium]|nr:gluconate 2-dehydrogenase subunit 3 family protein [bacterium]